MTSGPGGDEDVGDLFDRHARAVYNHAFRLTGSWSLAEEITQRTFLTAWQRRADIRLVDGSPLPWLLVTAGHHARTEQRTLTRWRNRLLRSPTAGTEADPADDVAGRLDDERRMRAVLAAVGRLPRAEREAVALCLWSGVGYPEAAAVLGVTETAVRSRVSRARARLTRLLTESPEPTTGPPVAGPSTTGPTEPSPGSATAGPARPPTSPAVAGSVPPADARTGPLAPGRSRAAGTAGRPRPARTTLTETPEASR
ncbi:RNA polymerase sigma-70 factor (ECF subfamily) [Actinoplanes octamycinicus]|uniref:RNA polymerase sigma-70 factor (ECF subfamily) n=1 Tax=Actinoplanes octamycinicus TaxID=135948 RepID=A0A7W7H687_9ACTN|nr:sigma-70 family RNA polymerase sigma factor [Actinoplanes octamycinicus]MBB4744597.1 RNA polymerase sigma-70 factor (ECF subfamily) [Actinoplanes octamycinicus]